MDDIRYPTDLPELHAVTTIMVIIVHKESDCDTVSHWLVSSIV